MSEKKIGFFCTKVPSIFPLNKTEGHEASGAGESLIDLVKHLKIDFSKIYIFTLSSISETQVEKYKNIELIRYRPSFEFLKNIFTTNENLYSSKFIYGPRKYDLDLIHCQLGHPLADLSSLFYKYFISDIPIILSIRGVPKKGWGPLFRRIGMNIYLKTIYKKILGVSDRIVIQSEGVLNEFSMLKNYKNKIRIVPNGVNFDIYSKYNKKEDFQPSLLEKIKDFKYNLLYVGNLIEGKGIYTLIDAYEKVIEKYPSTSLILVGKGPMRSHILDRSKRKDYFDKICLTGYISDEEKLAKIYSYADLFVFPSLGEGFPRVVLESMAAGTPCLVSDIDPNFYAIGEGEYGFLAEVKNSADFSKKIIDYFEMKKEIKNNLKDKVINFANKHSWNDVAKQMEVIYMNSLNS